MPNLTCSIDGCDRKLKSKSAGLCGTHHQRMLRHGSAQSDTAVMLVVQGDAMTRFTARIKVMPSGCHEWQGGKLTDNYGSFRYQNKSWPAHRWLWVQTHGPIPAGLVVRHKCDNPPCANLAHLELGTKADNADDMVKRGRSLVGVLNHANKLSERQVLEIKIAIRDRTAKQKDLALKYGVTPTLITSIKKGRAWTHITL